MEEINDLYSIRFEFNNADALAKGKTDHSLMQFMKTVIIHDPVD